MKVRDSGMPALSYWESLFDVPLILDKMLIDDTINLLIEIGSGYATFTLPAANKISGKIIAYDIETTLIEVAKNRMESDQVLNIDFILRDVIGRGTGLENNVADYVMLFNILHHERPDELLDEAYRILKSRGKVGLIHWRSDIETPRGPELSIRPKPEQITSWLIKAGFQIFSSEPISLLPWHYGVIGVKA